MTAILELNSVVFTGYIIIIIIDSDHAKRVVTYWERWGNHDYNKINVSIVPMEKLYIFGKKGFPSFRKYIVFHWYYGDIFLAVNMISPIFSTFPST